ncbi:hypothetical protein DM02DRAFT_18406 [Periconia macrospinosa]|uniref:Uncharacterized protein n=1 Tax=Periconia macrospinosa TaxID=97972 RepID=A0A2V1DP99_9PLEO|nr:hypothetical protein DM02DRAFT_18406 [Periconia macrospinosa]
MQEFHPFSKTPSPIPSIPSHLYQIKESDTQLYRTSHLYPTSCHSAHFTPSNLHSILLVLLALFYLFPFLQPRMPVTSSIDYYPRSTNPVKQVGQWDR